MITKGKPHIYGVPAETLPLSGFPSGKIRLCFRSNEFAKAYVKAPDGIRCFHIRKGATSFECGVEVGRNWRA